MNTKPIRYTVFIAFRQLIVDGCGALDINIVN